MWKFAVKKTHKINNLISYEKFLWFNRIIKTASFWITNSISIIEILFRRRTVNIFLDQYFKNDFVVDVISGQ